MEVGRVYAEALLEYGVEHGVEEEILNDVKIVGANISGENTFIRLVSAPSISVSQRKKMLGDVFSNSVDPHLVYTMQLMVENGRAEYLLDFLREYTSLYNDVKNIAVVKVETAVPLTERQEEKLGEKLSSGIGKTVQLDISVNPDLLGGMKIQYGDQVLDASAGGRLRDIAKKINITR